MTGDYYANDPFCSIGLEYADSRLVKNGCFYNSSGWWSDFDGKYRKYQPEGGLGFDSDKQMGSYGPRSHNELRPKSKFYNLLIYAGYPIQQ